MEDKSKFGTIVKAPSGGAVAALERNQRKQLYNGSSIVLGQQSSSPWSMQIRWEPLIFCASRMSSEMRGEMQESMTKLGAHLVSRIEGCTHIMMPHLIATKKLLVGSAKGLPIVRPQYVEESVRQVSESSSLPEAREFPPPAEDDNLKEMLTIDSQQRRALLRGLTFYCFLESQYKDLNNIIKAYGGKMLLIKSCSRQTWMKPGRFVVLSPYDIGQLALGLSIHIYILYRYIYWCIVHFLLTLSMMMCQMADPSMGTTTRAAR